MASYGGFASVYDELMTDVPYARWADLVDSLIARYGVSKPAKAPENRRRSGTLTEEEALRQERDLVIDLCCGTGTMSCLLADRGYDVTGIDLSPEMLMTAQEKNAGRKKPVPYLCQDMRALDLYCTAGTFVSVCDSVNCLLTDRDMLRMLRGVNRFLFPGGLFIFDFHTRHMYRDVLGDRLIADCTERAEYIWENAYSTRTGRSTAQIVFYVREEDGRYRRFTETYVRRGYTLTQIRGLIGQAGMTCVTAMDADTGRAPHAGSERIFVVARERGKTGRSV